MEKFNTRRSSTWVVRVRGKRADRSAVGIKKRKRLDWAARNGYDVRVRLEDGREFQWGSWEEIGLQESELRELKRLFWED